MPPLCTDTLYTSAPRSSSRASFSGTAPAGEASTASEATSARRTRSVSQPSSKLASDGAMISSASAMTKAAVSSSSRADRPTGGFSLPSQAGGRGATAASGAPGGPGRGLGGGGVAGPAPPGRVQAPGQRRGAQHRQADQRAVHLRLHQRVDVEGAGLLEPRGCSPSPVQQ